MFNLQPGTGLGFTGSKQIALGLGGASEVAQPPVVEPVPIPATGGGGSGGVRPYREPYRKQWEDVQRESNRARILREDQEIIDVIIALLTKGIL